MDAHNLSASSIDAIGIGMWKGIDSRRGFASYVEAAMERSSNNPSVMTLVMERLNGSIKSDEQHNKEFLEGLDKAGLGAIPRYQCHHHYAHALSAAEFSPFDDALVVTLDGRGDFMSGSVSTWTRGGGFKLLRSELELDSLGSFYGWITQYLGFVPDRHEGKITGLAAAGNSSMTASILRKMISCKDGKITANIGKYYAPYMRAKLPALEGELINHSKEDIAAGAQLVLEEVVVQYITYYLKKSGKRNVCLAGGIFANVLLNMAIRSINGIENLFVFPHMGDGGISSGGAAYACLQMGEVIKPLKDAYLGPEFSQDACRAAIEEVGLVPEVPAILQDEVAKLLNKGLVIGLFQGRMEYGPRALGNRSIMVRATDPEVNDTLNKRLARSEFMPFAPVTMIEYASMCYKDWSDQGLGATTRYMTCCYSCTDFMSENSPAVVHIDGTARPQIVSSDDNPIYWGILASYHKITGILTLINTSFNEHEAPIVCRPEEAVDVLVKGGIDVLVMPPYLVKC
jgi:carbamoyltransferase